LRGAGCFTLDGGEVLCTLRFYHGLTEQYEGSRVQDGYSDCFTSAGRSVFDNYSGSCWQPLIFGSRTLVSIARQLDSLAWVMTCWLKCQHRTITQLALISAVGRWSNVSFDLAWYILCRYIDQQEVHGDMGPCYGSRLRR